MPNNSELVAALRSAFSDPATIKNRCFDVLSDIASLSGSEEMRTQFQEFILRALDLRSSFSAYSDVLDSLVRRAGLYPYLEQQQLSFRDQLAYEYHKPINLESEFVFHSAQGEVYRRILSGENIALSAPTSYGKSLIVDAIIATGLFKNIVIVVPTIALIDETRRRLASRFKDSYKIVTHPSQKTESQNIFVLTQERVLEMDSLQHVDFFVIDEFYKLDTTRDDGERASLLNQAFYKLHKHAKRFYMLGPSIFGLSSTFEQRVDCRFVLDNYTTVVSEVHPVDAKGEEIPALVDLCKSLKDSTSIFCRSPKRASEVARALIEAGVGNPSKGLTAAADWIAENYHEGWHFGEALRQGIAIHHGRIPRSLAQYAVRKFNDGELSYMICTSTLIEGVNTKARNMIILDNEINRNAIDFFTYSNIKGRSGRMMQHMIGHVYVFHSPPQYELPLVDVPAFTQSSTAPTSLLIQLDDDDLNESSRERVKKYSDQAILSYDVLRKNAGINPDAQLELATEIQNNVKAYHTMLYWSGLPNYDQLGFVCNLIWNAFDGGRLASGSVRSAKQLTFLINKLADRPTTRDLIIEKLKWEKDPDEAVQQTLDFLRLWAMFHFPKLLKALDNVQRDVFRRNKLPTGNYEALGGLVENLYLDPALIAIDEYGIPLEIARKLQSRIASGGDLDVTLEKLKSLRAEELKLTSFEEELLFDSVSHM